MCVVACCYVPTSSANLLVDLPCHNKCWGTAKVIRKMEQLFDTILKMAEKNPDDSWLPSQL